MHHYRRILILILILCLGGLSFGELSARTTTKSANAALKNNPYLTDEMRHWVRPFVVPDQLPIKPALDEIFKHKRVTKDGKTFNAAGFVTLYKKPRSFIRVASHPKVPGYLFKVYLDTEIRIKQNTPGWQWLVKRCEGAKQVRKALKACHSKYFAVPKKWLYPLPAKLSRSHSSDFILQPIVLVVEDMQLVDEATNKRAWKTEITRAHLDELYAIIAKAKGSSYRPDNIWLNKSGKFCFIDTEYPGKQADFRSIRKYLNAEMRQYWDSLVQR